MAVSVLRRMAGLLTTPLRPQDFLGLLDPARGAPGPAGRVLATRRETAGAVTLSVQPPRGWPGHAPGQHVAVGIDVDGVRTWRTYSISSPPGAAAFDVTVKEVPGGRVSARLSRARPGDVLHLGPPTGGFVLPGADPGPLLFVTAGSGITPVAAMLRTLAAGPAPLDAVLVHSDRTAADMIFGPQLRALAGGPGLRLVEHHTRSSPGARRLRAADVAARCPDWAARRTYACGPEGLLADLEAYWAQADAAHRLHTERFRPCSARLPGGPGEVRFARSGVAAPTDGASSLLDVGEGLGVAMPSGCRQGVCHTCVAVLREGRVRDLRHGRERGGPGEPVQTCVSVPVGVVTLDL